MPYPKKTDFKKRNLERHEKNRPGSKTPGFAPLHLMLCARDRTSRNATITTRETGVKRNF